MFCPKCGHRNPDDAAFCMKCGVAMNPGTGGPAAPVEAVHPPDWLKAAVASAPSAAPSAPPASHAPGPVHTPPAALQPEQQVWTGSASWKSIVTPAWACAFVLPLPLIIYAFSMRAHFAPHNGLWSLSLFSLVPILVFLGRLWMLRTTSYRVTNERISVLRGLLSRESDDIQLMRVSDVQFYQTLMNRLLNVGDIRVLSTDKTVPDLVILGVESPAAFKEMLWNLVRERRRNTVALEQLNQGIVAPTTPF